MTAESEPRFLEVGRIGKAHGLRGEVVVEFVTDRTDDRTRPGTELWTNGSPLKVVTARPHQKKWLIGFDGVTDRTQAERLKGSTLTAPAIDDPDAVFVHELIGKQLVDQDGVARGEIVAVVENPASDLMELADGTLVPMAFLTSRDSSAEPSHESSEDDASVVEVAVPLGLFDDDE